MLTQVLVALAKVRAFLVMALPRKRLWTNFELGRGWPSHAEASEYVDGEYPRTREI